MEPRTPPRDPHATCNNTGMSEMPLEPDSPEDDGSYSSEDWHTDGGSHLEMMIDRATWPAADVDLARDRLRLATDTTCETFGWPRLVVSGLFCDNDRIAMLNARFRGKDGATNVLSFPGGETGLDDDGMLAVGDIAIAFETVRDEAVRDARLLQEHLVHLWVHGLLHLMGHDHENDEEAEAMEAGEIAVLAKLGIADPYAGPEPETVQGAG